MKNILAPIVEFAKTHRVLTAIGFVLLAPSFVFGLLFNVLGFIGWARIVLALVIVAGYVGYKFVRSELDDYKETVDDVVEFGRSIKDDFYR